MVAKTIKSHKVIEVDAENLIDTKSEHMKAVNSTVTTKIKSFSDAVNQNSNSRISQTKFLHTQESLQKISQQNYAEKAGY